jgi:hypothetical protein
LIFRAIFLERLFSLSRSIKSLLCVVLANVLVEQVARRGLKRPHLALFCDETLYQLALCCFRVSSNRPLRSAMNSARSRYSASGLKFSISVIAGSSTRGPAGEA